MRCSDKVGTEGKDMEIAEVKKQIRENSLKFYKAKNSESKKAKSMLLVSHTLERGGAPLVLLELIDWFKLNFDIVFISMNDGDLREEYLDKGLSINIGNSITYAACPTELWDAFDVVFLNTIVSHWFLPIFQNRKVPVLWWLHEPEILFQSTFGRIIHFSLLSNNIKILSVTKETAALVQKYYGVETELLHMGLEDRYVGEVQREDKKVRFFMPAKFQAIKGQDIAAQAIMELPPQYLEKAEFIFAGARDNTQPEYYELISKLAIAVPSVVMLGEISKKEVYDWYQHVDCVIAPSRTDATPTTIVEAMMFRKICACSTGTGISRYLNNGVNGFVFQADDVQALKDTLMYVIEHYEELDSIRDGGRKVYLEQFERGKVEKVLENCISNRKFRKEDNMMIEKENQPLVSVIMPCYNHEKYVSQSIESVLNQTYTNLEFIVLDNGSTDGSYEVIKQYEDRIDRIIHFDKNNLPQYIPTVLSYCNGKYIAFMTSDDIWESDKLEIQVKAFAENPNIKACFTWISTVDEELNPIEMEGNNCFCQLNRSRYEWIDSLLIQGDRLAYPTAVVDRKVYQDIQKELRLYYQYGDMYTWILLLLKYDIYVVPQNLAKFRWHASGENSNSSALNMNSITRTINEESIMIEEIIEKMDDVTFIRTFGKYFLNPAASSHEEVMCEKYFLLVKLSENKPQLEQCAIRFYYKHSGCVKNSEGLWIALLKYYDYQFMDFQEYNAKHGIGMTQINCNQAQQMSNRCHQQIRCIQVYREIINGGSDLEKGKILYRHRMYELLEQEEKEYIRVLNSYLANLLSIIENSNDKELVQGFPDMLNGVKEAYKIMQLVWNAFLSFDPETEENEWELMSKKLLSPQTDMEEFCDYILPTLIKYYSVLKEYTD